MSELGFLFVNGVVSKPLEAPSVTTLLQSHPGAYTTSRTHSNRSVLLFWERHLSRLCNSARILFDAKQEFLFKPNKSEFWISVRPLVWDSVIKSLVNDSMRTALPMALKEMQVDEELAITTLLSGNLENFSGNGSGDEELISEVFDVYVHVGVYVPLVFGVRENGARLAVVGRGREVANAKYTDWVRARKHLEKFRPPSVTELILSNDGDQMLEGCLTNFFVVCQKDGVEDGNESEEKLLNVSKSTCHVEVQTAPITDGVLPGVIRQIVIEMVNHIGVNSCQVALAKQILAETTTSHGNRACVKHGIPVREVAPSWSKREQWKEAFITNGLRLLQHVETVQAPCSWKSLKESWKEVTWEEKRFEGGPGSITSIIQEEIMKKATLEGYPITSLTS